MLILHFPKQMIGFFGAKSMSAWLLQEEAAHSLCLINMLIFDTLPKHRMNRAYMTNKYSRIKGDIIKSLKS